MSTYMQCYESEFDKTQVFQGSWKLLRQEMTVEKGQGIVKCKKTGQKYPKYYSLHSRNLIFI